jgi:glutathione S-transferase
MKQRSVRPTTFLAGRDFLAADRFSIADITAVVGVDFARLMKVKPREQHRNLQRWRAGMAQRASMALSVRFACWKT